jgi:hypothetical protein
MKKRTRKGRKLHRRKGILYEYNWDGGKWPERIPGFWKRYWRKWQLREDLKFENGAQS